MPSINIESADGGDDRRELEVDISESDLFRLITISAIGNACLGCRLVLLG